MPHPRPTRRAYAAAAAAVAVATAAAAAVDRLRPRGPTADRSGLVLVYLPAVVWAAVRCGWAPAVAASIGSVLAFDFCFVPPRYTMAVTDPAVAVTLPVMLIVAAVTATLAHRERAAADRATAQARRTAALLTLSRRLADAADPPAVAAAVVACAADVFAGPAAVLADGDLAPLATTTPFDLGPAERSAATATARSGVSATTVGAAFLPVPVGVLAVRSPRVHDADYAGLLDAFAAQATAALDRGRLAGEARAAWERVEAELIRNTLLSSVSHDLRTPLAAIAGAAETMLVGAPPAEPVRRDLTGTILDESRRLERLVTNLLDVTRLESGGLALRLEWHAVAELVGAALHRARHRLGDRPLSVDVPADLPMVRVDAVAFGQVLANLLDNAAEHTPPSAAVAVSAAVVDDQMALIVADRGPGVPPGTEAQVFQKFFRAHGSTAGRHGVGLGLAICRGIVEAHGGTIAVANRNGGGAAFTVVLPLSDPPPAAIEN